MLPKKYCLAFFCTCLLLQLNAQLRLPRIIGSNMVLQQKQPVPIWGWAKPGNTVLVTMGAVTKSAVADTGGRWQITLPALAADFQPKQISITSHTSTIILTNILVGEVWLCSGQSNMEYTMKLNKNFAPPAKGADSAALELRTGNPQIRLFTVEKKIKGNDVVTAGWQESSDTALEQTSAAGYFFAKHLQQQLHVPVGVITSSWGGSRIERWTPEEAYRNSTAFATAAPMGTEPLKIDNERAGDFYKGMIAPMLPFAIKGVLWYQGESNCTQEEEPGRYTAKMELLINSWRKAFNNKALPFYYVLIAPHYYTRRKKDKLTHTDETLPLFWEQQIAASRIPNTGFITVSDLVDNLNDIHPSYKWEVGRRLCLLALAKTYGVKRSIYTGPVFESMERKKSKLILHFNNAAGLTTAEGNAPSFFTVAGEDGHFVTADAAIKGNTVILSSPQVAFPQQARLGWTEIAQPNLVNAAKLPAVPFRTDKPVNPHHQ